MANVDYEPLEKTSFTARRVRGSKLTRLGIAIEFADGCVATGDADIATGFGKLQLQKSILIFGFSTVESELRVLCNFHRNHGLFSSPNVVIKNTEDDTTLVLKPRRIWSSTVDAFRDDKQVGTFAPVSSLLQSRYEAVLDGGVPHHLGLVAIWCIMIRGAFVGE